MTITQQAKDIAKRTSGAYSFDRFRNWEAVTQCLLNLGLDDLQTEAVLISKWTRWACDVDDSGATYGRHTSTAMLKFMRGISKSQIEALTFETFGEIRGNK